MDITRDNLLSLIHDGLKHEGFSIAGLEKQSGVPKDTVRDFLRGKTQILRADKLQKILRILRPGDKLAVRFHLSAGAELMQLPDSHPKEYVDYPPGMDANSVEAVRVTGDAMAPVFLDGWVVYYTKNHAAASAGGKSDWKIPYDGTASDEPYAAFLGKPCVILLEDGRLMLRTLRAGGASGTYTLAAYGTDDITRALVKDVYKIVFIKTA